jgi:hypothetical protein
LNEQDSSGIVFVSGPTAMRITSLIMLAVLAAVCHAGTPADTSAAPAPVYADRASSAMVFDPPATIGQAPLNLNRSDRTRGAFWGYEQSMPNVYNVIMDDNQRNDGQSSFQRRAITIRGSISYN